MEVTNITTTWSDTRRFLTVTASLDGYSNCKIQVGYSPNTYTYEGENLLNLSNLDHTRYNALYIRGVALDGSGQEVVATEKYTTIALPHPILGIVKTCDGEKNVVDILQKRNGKCPTRWQGGIAKIVSLDVDFLVDSGLYLKSKVCEGQLAEEPAPPDLPDGCKLLYWGEYYDWPEPTKPGDYSVTIYTGPGQHPIVKWVKEGEVIEEPPIPPISGNCTFYGWYEKE